MPDISRSRSDDLRNSGNQNIVMPRILEFRISENTDFPKSENTDSWKSGYPEFRISENPYFGFADFQESVYPDIHEQPSSDRRSDYLVSLWLPGTVAQTTCGSPEVRYREIQTSEIRIFGDLEFPKSVFSEFGIFGIQDFRKIRTSGSPDFRISGIPDFRKSGFPEIRKPGSLGNRNPEIRKSGSPEIRKSCNPEIRKSGNPEVRKSGNPEVRKSGSPEIRRCVEVSRACISARGRQATTK